MGHPGVCVASCPSRLTRGARVRSNIDGDSHFDLGLSVRAGATLRASIELAPDAPHPQIEVLVPTMPSLLSARAGFFGEGLWGFSKADLSVTASDYTPQLVVSLGPDEYHGTVWRIYGLPAGEEITHWDIGTSTMVANLGIGSTIEGFSFGRFTDATHFRRYNFGRTASLQIYADLDAARNFEGYPRYMIFDTSSPVTPVTVDWQSGEQAHQVDGVVFGAAEVTMVSVWAVAGPPTEGAWEFSKTGGRHLRDLRQGYITIDGVRYNSKDIYVTA